MRFSIIIILLSLATFAFAQSSKINNDEKKRLENQFKALKTFYINEDGLVVYQKQGNEAEVIDDDKVEYNNTGDTLTVYVKDASESNHEENTTTDFYDIPATEYSEPVSVDNTYDTPFINKQPLNPLFIKKEAKTPDMIVVDNSSEEEIPVVQKETISSPVLSANTNEAEEESEIFEEETPTKKSVFDKKTSKYKTMEEAALAVEALLEDLKKEQAQIGNSGSMSSRLSGGVRSSLRKKPASSSSTPRYSSTQASQTSNSSYSDFGDEPTYYINGRIADKEEIDLLKKKDIVNRQIRTRNTQSGNPNGEIWYEVKEN
ncbi:MAG: hypothetical protein E6772_12975 [Dysgonomonas sp.]|nr:hypothetical protein [Dysgonomonas sp.]